MKKCPKCDSYHNKQGIFCCRSCANSRSWNEEDKIKKSQGIKRYLGVLEENGIPHPCKGKPGWKHSNEMKEIKRQKSLEDWDKKGRLPPEHFVVANRIYSSSYRARKRNATPANTDMKLIAEIYRMCPSGYEVDHIIALAEGGPHHPDNLQYLPAMENRKKNRTQNYDKNLAISWKKFI